LFEATEATLVPRLFVVVMVNVYAVPSMRPVTVTGHVVAEACAPPGEAVAVYEVIAAPPLLAGAVQLTVACWSPATAEIPVGGSDGPVGVTALEAADAAPEETALLALTVNV
jgi:hypothetical protein